MVMFVSKKRRPGEVLQGGYEKKMKIECGNDLFERRSIEGKLLNKTTEDTTGSVIDPLLSREEKSILKRELISAVRRGDSTGPLRWFLRKHGFFIYNPKLIESTFNSLNDDTLLELRRALKGSFSTSMQKEDLGMMEITETKKLSSIQSRIRAARAAKQAKSDLQLRRDKERQKLENMVRTVIIGGDNLTSLKYLENLCQYSGIKNPLEKIGLRLKEENYYGYDEYSDDEDNGIISDELEEGEICSY